MELTLYREEPILREARYLPAATYNLAHLLLAHSGNASVFVPIRVMQFLAIIDQAEIIFVDREMPKQVQLAWQSFKRQDRSALDERVQFEAAFYTQASLDILPRLMSEFPKAMQVLAEKERIERPADVLPFPSTKP
jgi:hypothetical protein